MTYEKDSLQQTTDAQQAMIEIKQDPRIEISDLQNVDTRASSEYECDRVLFEDRTSIVLAGGKWEIDENYPR